MSSPSTRPIVLVTGATGAQGGSVARHLLAGSDFAVRALTREPDSAAARALLEGGAEVVAGDLRDRPSVRAALRGCYGVFGVTNYWEHFAGEVEQGRNLLYALAASEIEHLVLSTLPSAHQRSGGTLDVPCFEGKAQLTRTARELELPATFVELAFYYESFLDLYPPSPDAEGTLSFGFPQGDTPLAAVAAEDLGGVVAKLLERPAEFLGATVDVVGDELPAAGYAREMSRALGRPVVFHHVPREVFAALPVAAAAERAATFELYRSFTPSRRAELERCRELYPEMQSFAAWMDRNRDRFLSE